MTESVLLPKTSPWDGDSRRRRYEGSSLAVLDGWLFWTPPGEGSAAAAAAELEPKGRSGGGVKAMVAIAAESIALQVVHTVGVEGHLPVPGSTVVRGWQTRPWLVLSVAEGTAVLRDLASGTVEVSWRALAPDPVDLERSPGRGSAGGSD